MQEMTNCWPSVHGIKTMNRPTINLGEYEVTTSQKVKGQGDYSAHKSSIIS